LESRISLDDLESFLSLDCNLLATAGDTPDIIKTETPGTALPNGDPHQPTISALSYPAKSTPNVLDCQYQPARSTHVLDRPFATSSILGRAFATSSILDRPIVPSLKGEPSGQSSLSPNLLPIRSTSDSLLNPKVVLQLLQPIAIGYDMIGKIAVALARYSFFWDDVLQVSTLKGKGSKHALDAHKLEALHFFLHSVQPFSSLRKNDYQ
jgi:hypothetical protein